MSDNPSNIMQQENKILVIDDERDMLDSLYDLLSDEGYIVDVANTVQKALLKVKQNYYKLILLDIKMPYPNLDGLNLLKIFKQKMVNSIIILMTAYPSFDTSIEALRHGATDYIIKPFSFQELCSLIGHYINEKDKELYAHNLLKNLNAMIKKATNDIENFTEKARIKLNRNII